ncbi:MAG: hypothetical protein KAJ42_00875 [Gemmatimonadetes bacterium]|nr:hypothetical protein [Gemmatimonadota bacterium]
MILLRVGNIRPDHELAHTGLDRIEAGWMDRKPRPKTSASLQSKLTAGVDVGAIVT